MIICGLKLTHDGAMALIDNGKLILSIEMEKLCNNNRFTEISDTAIIPDILEKYGYSTSSVDIFAIDGWGGVNEDALAIQPRLEIGKGYNILSALNNSKPYKIRVGTYEESTLKSDILKEWSFEGLKMGNVERDYCSFLHVSGHVISAYCTSDFARNNESSYILVWDGGMYPRLYFFDAQSKSIENLGPIFLLIGNIYSIFSQHFGPFKVKGNFAKDSLSVAGKVMAYIALGSVKKELFKYFDDIYKNCYVTPMGFANVFAREFKLKIKDQAYSDEDILCSFHAYLEEMLIKKLEKKVSRYDIGCKNLCISGGCALNIKWNSAIRNSGLFNKVYVPPFPNDSGSAIGVACCAMLKTSPNLYLNWNVYSGPEIIKNQPDIGWISKECSVSELAQLLYFSNEPVVFLNGKAELGPRALGNRSIIASPESKAMKDLLNYLKLREPYRPVSPICLEEKAKEIFEPGISDPYMLFDHIVRNIWESRIPAICHLDGTARLQTVNSEQNPVVAELLLEFEKLSGIPILCNTSANYKGCGFFPDIFSTTKWNKVNYVWCDNVLFERECKIDYSQVLI